jgi:putative aldouronate transport system permease protein
MLYPIYFIVIASFSDPLLVNAGKVLFFPSGIHTNAYRMVLRDPDILTGYRNTLFYTFSGTVISLTLTVLAAYPLSRRNLVGRALMTWILVFTMFFSGGLIPTYLLVSSLGMRNTVWALIIPGAVSVWNVIIMRTFFQTTIPQDLQDAAQVDGCSNIGQLMRIFLPLSKPVIAVMVLYYGVAQWNSFFNALIYITETRLHPLQLILRSILVQNRISEEMMSDIESLAMRQMLVESIKYAVIVVSIVPIMTLYPFLQKYFVKGVMIGAIKG